jgi:hypothetical protein
MPEPRIGRLGEVWVRGSGTEPEIAARILPMAARQVKGAFAFPVVALAGYALAHSLMSAPSTVLGDGMGAAYVTGVVMAGMYSLPQTLLRSVLNRPLTDREITDLLIKPVRAPMRETGLARVLTRLQNRVAAQESAATLEGAYADLLLAASATTMASPAEATIVRSTLRQLGGAVASLELGAAGRDTVEAADLVADAEMLAARARREHDPVVAGSLLRQAQAKVAQAKVVEKNGQLRRRSAALREEIRAQIAAAKSSLPHLAANAGVRSGDGTFRSIEESVRALAVEAISVAAARTELSVALGETPAAAAGLAAASPAHVTRVTGTENETPAIRGRRGA